MCESRHLAFIEFGPPKQATAKWLSTRDRLYIVLLHPLRQRPGTTLRRPDTAKRALHERATSAPTEGPLHRLDFARPGDLPFRTLQARRRRVHGSGASGSVWTIRGFQFCITPASPKRRTWRDEGGTFGFPPKPQRPHPGCARPVNEKAVGTYLPSAAEQHNSPDSDRGPWCPGGTTPRPASSRARWASRSSP